MEIGFIIGASAITLVCGAIFGPWGLMVLPLGLLLGWLLSQ